MNNEQKEQMIKTNAFDGVSFDPEKRLLIQRSLTNEFIKINHNLS